jgi:hypothetical protein
MTPEQLSPATEKHFTPAELGEKWGLSEDTIRRAFEDVPGVLRIKFPRLLHRKTKPRVTLRIPASVAARMHEQWSSVPTLEVKRRRRGIE